MIIEKGTKRPITMLSKPNENWTSDDSFFVVDDNSGLGQKILQYAPYYDEILDSNGVLIDIVPTERPLLPPPEPTELELLKEKYSVLQSAVDFIIMNP